MRQSLKFSAVLLFFCIVLGCSSTPVHHLSIEEEKLRREVFIGTQLSEKAEDHFDFKRNTAVQHYLKKKIQQLLPTEKKRATDEVTVELVDDRNGLWRSFVIPGNRFFISLGTLQSIEYEHELAALISIQVSLLSRKSMIQLIDSIEKSNSPDALRHLTWDRVLNFSIEEEVESMKQAVEILYQAGYDPRGLVSLINRYTVNPDHAPYNQSKQEFFLENLRREIAQLPPLRNPIVKSDEFTQIKQRINRL